MAVYTTQVRTICEMFAGETEAAGFDDIDEIIERARPHIFSFTYPIFDQAYKSVLETKILKHFYMREIGAETVGLWRLYLSQRLDEIMPYYNQLYSAEVAFAQVDPLKEADYERSTEHSESDRELHTGTDREGGQNSTTTGTTTTGSETDTKSYSNYRERFSPGSTEKRRKSDTPQGGITGVENDQYLSEAEIVSHTGYDDKEIQGIITDTRTPNITTTGSITENPGRTFTHGETIETFFGHKIVEKVQGNMGSTDWGTVFNNFRSAMINVDQMLMDDLEVCFMQIY